MDTGKGGILLAGVILAAGVTAHANSDFVFPATSKTLGDSVTFSFAEGRRAASAAFGVDDSGAAPLLQIRLSNVGQDVLYPDEVLTALFFDLAGDPPLTPESALVAPGSEVVFDSPGTDVVGGEWAYWQHTSELPPPLARQGISSTGLDLVGPHDLFPGNNLCGALNPNGMEYGLLSASDDPGTDNHAVTGQFPFIRHEVDLTLSGLPAGFDVTTDVSNVAFWYGTDRTPLPEPLTMAGVALAAVSVGAYVRRRHRA